MKGKIYLICNPLTDTFKIGVTKRNTEKRLREIQTGNPGEVFVLEEFESEYPYKLEKMLHRYFYSKKAINEWFNLNSNDVTNFKSLCSKYEGLLKSLAADDINNI